MKLSKRKEKALRQSIAHWERMANGKRRKMFNHATGGYELEEPFAGFCSLCVIFSFNGLRSSVCTKCPVYMKTGRENCDNTPYEVAEYAFYRYGIDSYEFKKSAQEEVDFLKSLL